MLSSSKLANELLAIGQRATEAGALEAWADALLTYLEDAQSNELPVLPGGLEAARPALVAGLAGLGSGGPDALQQGLLALWGALVPSACWPTTTAITPPAALAGLAAALQVVFTANMSGALSAELACQAIAAVLHGLMQGGLAAWPDPVGAQPIL